MESASKVIVDTAFRHSGQRVDNHFEKALVLRISLGAQKQLEHSGIGKFRRLAEPAVLGIIGLREILRTLDNNSGSERTVALDKIRHAAQRADNLLDALGHICRSLGIRLSAGV